MLCDHFSARLKHFRRSVVKQVFVMLKIGKQFVKAFGVK